jgi:hypothetical protein
MDLRVAVREFVNEGRELLERLRSSEGDSLTGAELHVLEVQLYLLNKEVTKRKHRILPPPQKSQSRPSLLDSSDQAEEKGTSHKGPA